jgi:regulator of sirC expression with transglutaminase-like and TPR domain
MTTTPLPLCCNPVAFELMLSASRTIEAPESLLRGAVALSMHEITDADPNAVDAAIQGFADTVRARVRGTQKQALLAHLHEYLFDELGFRGNEDDYYVAGNSYLTKVLKTKRGLPIALSLIYKSVAERVGFRCWGVNLPGHFVCGIESEGATMLVDAFSGGRLLSIDEAHKHLQQQYGMEVEWSDELLTPATNRQWLTRMLQNLLNLFGSRGRYANVAAILELEMILWPEEEQLQRDLGLVLARCGLSGPACSWLESYLENNPDDPQSGELKQLLQVLK